MVETIEKRNSKKEKKKRNKGFPYRKTRKKLTEVEKKIRYLYIIGLLAGWLTGSLIVTTYVTWFTSTPLFYQELDFFTGKSFNIVANSWEDSKVVEDLSYLCSLKENDLNKVECVYNFISFNIVLGYHDPETNTLNKPDEIFNSSSLCRDAAVLFKSTLNKMEIESDFVFKPRHVYNRVYLENMTCDIDIVNGVYECK